MLNLNSLKNSFWLMEMRFMLPSMLANLIFSLRVPQIEIIGSWEAANLKKNDWGVYFKVAYSRGCRHTHLPLYNISELEANTEDMSCLHDWGLKHECFVVCLLNSIVCFVVSMIDRFIAEDVLVLHVCECHTTYARNCFGAGWIMSFSCCRCSMCSSLVLCIYSYECFFGRGRVSKSLCYSLFLI